jgi:TonB family protein
MPHALLLSPDDQAVSAITGVLDEMSVTCERPLDGVSAAKKLNSQSFDLVLVDCENLPAAKLIFDVCRRGKSGNNPVPIAIVDGRAGLPTAFRLGAELILTKPVAKDQARSTIRSAVGRVRKDFPGNENAIEDQSSSTGASTSTSSEERAHAAAASSQPATYAEYGPRFARGEVPPSYLTAALTASGLTTRMSGADEAEGPTASAKLSSSAESSSDATFSEAPHSYAFASDSFASDSSASGAIAFDSLSDSPAADASSTETGAHRSESVNANIAGVVDPSEELLMAEFDRREQNESAAAESKPEGSKPETLECDRIPARPVTRKTAAQFPSSRPRGRKKSRAPLVASLMLVVAAGGFYGAWKYQPGFKEIAKPEIDHLLDFAGKGLPPSTPKPTKPSAQVTAAKASTSAPAPQTSTSPDQIPATASEPATNSAAVTGSGAASSNPVQAAAVTTVAAVSPTAAAAVVNQAEASKTTAGKSDETKTGETRTGETKTSETASSVTQPGESKKDAVTASAAALPGENSAIVLSSKGAEKRLAHSVPPQYPAEAKQSKGQGTVVLKTIINENGEVAGVRLVDGNVALAPAAMQAVKQWRYRPYVRDGKAQPFQTLVFLDFQHP